MKLSFLLRSALITALASAPCAAQVMPQDYWYLERTWGSQGTGQGQFSQSSGITVGSDELLYVVDGSRVQVFQQDGQFVRTWQTASAGPLAIASGTDGNLYLLTLGTVYVYSPTGTVIRQWNVPECDYNSRIATAENGKVFVSDPSGGQVLSFANDGAPLNKIGSPGQAPGQLDSQSTLTVGPDGLLYVSSPWDTSVFKQNGEFVREWSKTGGLTGPAALAATADNIIIKGSKLVRPEGTMFRELSSIGSMEYDHVAVSKAGRIFAFGSNKIKAYTRSYRSTTTSTPPQPYVSQVQQRPASPILDIDFKVTDTDSATVEAYPLGFVDGIKDFAHILRITSLVEGTDAKRGTTVPTGVTHRLSWNAAADWSTQFGELQVEILTNDGRPMLPFEFLTIPAVGGNPELRISRSPYTNSDFLHLWFWLLAKADPEITLVNGVVKGVGGIYNGQSLTNGTTTTAAGRAFLFQRLQVREATQSEVTRASLGSNGSTINRWIPRFSVGPATSSYEPANSYPQFINEYGFDTGPWSSGTSTPAAGNYWAVPLN